MIRKLSIFFFIILLTMPTYGAMKGGLTKSTADDTYLTLAFPSQTVSQIPAFNGGASGVSAPFTVDSTFLVSNLNADLWDGYQFADYLDQAVKTTSNVIFNQITLGDGD